MSIMSIPYSIGTSVVITQANGIRVRSRHSHVPFPSWAIFEGNDVKWPLISPEQRSVSIGERIVILGGHPLFGIAGSLEESDAEQMMDSYYPKAVARQALWAAQCHCEAGHFSHFLTRAGGQRRQKTGMKAKRTSAPKESNQEVDRLHEEITIRGRAGGPGKGKKKGDRKGIDLTNHRLTDISHTMSRVLRHKGVTGMRRDGFVNVQNLLGHPYMVERGVTEREVDGIVAGLGGNNKFRFERGNSPGGITHMIRATQGHSVSLGVDADALPIDEDVLYVAHGTSLEAARIIVREGLDRCARAYTFPRVHAKWAFT